MTIWKVYHRMIQAYEQKDRKRGKTIMRNLIDSLDTQVTKGQPELRTLANTLRKRKVDILGYFDHPSSSNGPTEAINGRLEHLRTIALGFRNLENYITRSLLHTGGFRNQLQNQL